MNWTAVVEEGDYTLHLFPVFIKFRYRWIIVSYLDWEKWFFFSAYLPVTDYWIVLKKQHDIDIKSNSQMFLEND